VKQVQSTVGGIFTARFRLRSGEAASSVWLANYSESSMRAVGGRLIFTTQRIAFVPHRIDAMFKAKAWERPVADVVGAKVLGRAASGVLGGGLRRRLAIDFADGDQMLFVVAGANRKAAFIQREILHAA
jgi:hypothetical protein